MRCRSTRNEESIGQVVKRGCDWLKEHGHSSESVAQSEGIWMQFAEFAGGADQPYSERLRWTFLESFGITKHHRRLYGLKCSIRGTMWLLSIIYSKGQETGGKSGLPGRRGLGRKHSGVSKERLAPWLITAVMAHQNFCREQRGISDVTIYRYSEDVQRFLRFFEQQGGKNWNDLSGKLFSQFLLTLPQIKRKTRLAFMVSLRSFFHSLFCLGMITKDWSDCLPKVAPPWDSAESYRWKDEEIERLLGSIDRSSGIGKRNYAFILIAVRLGVRSGDICSLRLEDIDWVHSAIRFTQRKTGIGIALPLLPDVGLAVIDYLRHGRPKSGRREVFLMHQFRGKKPLKSRHSWRFLDKLKRKAGIQIPSGVHAGFHSFRHTLATRLLEEGSVWPTISSVLGHVNPDSTQIYAKASIPLLRKVAIDPEEVLYA